MFPWGLSHLNRRDPRWGLFDAYKQAAH